MHTNNLPEVIFDSPCNTKQKQSPGDDKVEAYDDGALDDNDQHKKESESDECDVDIEWNICFYYLLIILYWHVLGIHGNKCK